MTLTMTDRDFPHGLRCMRCDREIREGQPYAEHLEAMQHDYPLVALTCVYCEQA